MASEGGAAPRRSLGGRRVLKPTPSAALPENLREKAKDVESQRQKEEEFWAYFGRLVSEWNPCFDDDGEFRYVWDAEVGAHDVEVGQSEGGDMAQPSEPERVRLREVLDGVLSKAELGEDLDLEPIRSLVGKLVQTSGRHTDHGREPPKIGVHPCAQGNHKCPVCRYGFPHERFRRGGARKMRLEKSDREGSWRARFPRNGG